MPNQKSSKAISSQSASRRHFIKTFAMGTAFSSLGGLPWRATLLAAATPSAPNETAVFKVRLSDYPALSEAFGSVRLGVNLVRPDIEPFPDGDYWPFLINRGENGELYVLDSECQHASCVVPAYDDFNFGIRCPCHGSTYAIDGSILTGPTERPLRAYQFEFDGDDTLTIHIPGLGFRVHASPLSLAAGPRLQLSFPTHYGITYQVYSRAHLSDEWSAAPFSTTPDGPVTETSIFADGVPLTVYVNRPSSSGFFAVSMLLSEV